MTKIREFVNPVQEKTRKKIAFQPWDLSGTPSNNWSGAGNLFSDAGEHPEHPAGLECNTPPARKRGNCMPAPWQGLNPINPRLS